MAYKIKGDIEVGNQISAELAIVSSRVITGGSSLPSNTNANAAMVFPVRGSAGETRTYLELQGVYDNNVANQGGGAFIRFRVSPGADLGGSIGAIRNSVGAADLHFQTSISNTPLRLLSNNKVRINTIGGGDDDLYVNGSMRIDNGTNWYQLIVASPGISGQVLQSNGNNSTATWEWTGAVNATTVADATAGATSNAVGNYAFAARTNPTTSIALGSTVAGSTLTACSMLTNESFSGQGTGSRNGVGVSGILAGTWRCMGFSRRTDDLSNIDYSLTLWLRIS